MPSPQIGLGAYVSVPKRVLVVCQHFWPEAFRINDICDYLVERGCAVDVLCGIPNYPKGEFFEGYSYFRNRKQEHHGVRIRRAFEVPRGSNTSLRIFLNYISFPLASLFHVPRLLTREYDRIFLYQLSPVMMSIAGIIVGRIKNIETTMYVLDLWPENLFSVLDVKSPWLRRLATGVSHWHYRRVDKLVVLSEKMRRRLAEVTNVSPRRMLVLPQACEKIYETRIHDEVLADRFGKRFNILYAGNISPAQSFETVIEAAKQLKHEGLSDIEWIIVGDGMSRRWLEAEVEKASLTDCFHFEGLKPIEDIPRYTEIADVLIGCLAKSELLEATIPAKVMSYFAAGKPMVLAMDGEVRELVDKTIECGFAGPAGDAKTFAGNVKKVYGMTADERARMGSRGRDYHLKHFERNVILNLLYDFVFD